jgi:hypothetical protein
MADDRLRKVSFTGSTEVGKVLVRQSADELQRVSMELGGNAPFIVFEDADVDAAVDGAMIAKMRNMGEACTAANRFLGARVVADDFAEKLGARMGALVVGRGRTTASTSARSSTRTPSTRSASSSPTPSTTAPARRRRPARRRTRHLLPATVLVDVPAESEIVRQEIFGPVAPITTFASEDEAIERANDTEYGLASYVYTRDLARTIRVAERLQFGMVGINSGLISNAAAPFGGVKASGFGREGSFEGHRGVPRHDVRRPARRLTRVGWRSSATRRPSTATSPQEAYGSACFREWALGVAGDPDVLAWLQTLPERKRQANLSSRRRGGTASPPRDRTSRCATPCSATVPTGDRSARPSSSAPPRPTRWAGWRPLYPAFAGLGTRPLALLEVGASAGLCLYPRPVPHPLDVGRTAGTQETDPVGPLLECATTGELPGGRWRPSCGERASTSRRRRHRRRGRAVAGDDGVAGAAGASRAPAPGRSRSPGPTRRTWSGGTCWIPCPRWSTRRRRTRRSWSSTPP